MALTVPFFDYMMAFIGAFLSITTSMILPCLCYMKIVNKAASRRFKFELVVILAILVIGSFVAVSVSNIIDHLCYEINNMLHRALLDSNKCIFCNHFDHSRVLLQSPISHKMKNLSRKY